MLPPFGVAAASRCQICFDNLADAAAVCLASCRHTLHALCLRRQLAQGWTAPGGFITLEHADCPLCKTPLRAPALADALEPWDALRAGLAAPLAAALAETARAPLPAEQGPLRDAALRDALGGPRGIDIYSCSRCARPYFGGVRDCALEAPHAIDKRELICPRCAQAIDGSGVCAKHGSGGADDGGSPGTVSFKCRFCCSIAAFQCWGSTHFCKACHDNPPAALQLQATGALPRCPAGPLGVQLSGACPLGILHRPTGEEQVLGCSLCLMESKRRLAALRAGVAPEAGEVSADAGAGAPAAEPAGGAGAPSPPR